MASKYVCRKVEGPLRRAELRHVLKGALCALYEVCPGVLLTYRGWEAQQEAEREELPQWKRTEPEFSLPESRPESLPDSPADIGVTHQPTRRPPPRPAPAATPSPPPKPAAPMMQ